MDLAAFLFLLHVLRDTNHAPWPQGVSTNLFQRPPSSLIVSFTGLVLPKTMIDFSLYWSKYTFPSPSGSSVFLAAAFLGLGSA